MSDSWAAAGLDLHVRVNRSRVRRSLEESLREAVHSGQLLPGTVLPSSRSLATDLGIARNTVVEVYGVLVAEGWLVARSGARTVVADTGGRDRLPSLPTPAAVSQYPTSQRLDLRPGAPDLAAFPRREWLHAAQRAITLAPPSAFGYHEPRGRPELREALAGYLARTRGLRVTADQILVCLGITHGLNLVARTFRSQGATAIGVESHGLWVHHRVLTAHGLMLNRLPVDEDGAIFGPVLEELDAVLLTPGHQFPLGVTLSQQRRRQIASWARGRDRVIFEDDYEGEFHHGPDAPGALQPLAPDHVIYAGTTSKTLAPGLRLAWLVLPPGLLDEVTRAKGLGDGHNSSLDQLTLAEFITSGGYDRHIRRSRNRYRKRREQLRESLGHHRGGTMTGASTGLHALVELPAGTREDAVVAQAAAEGLSLQGLDEFRAPSARPWPPSLVIGYASPPDSEYRECLLRLAAVLRRH